MESGGDAVRRTRLATERTYLAWMRTGVACLATSVAVGRLVPGLTDGATWPFALLGVGWGLVGIALIAYGGRREREVQAALDHGGFAPLSQRALTALTGLGVLLGVGTLAVVVLQA